MVEIISLFRSKYMLNCIKCGWYVYASVCFESCIHNDIDIFIKHMDKEHNIRLLIDNEGSEIFRFHHTEMGGTYATHLCDLRL